MPFISIPSTTITNNVPIDGSLSGCSGLLNALTFTATTVTNVIPKQRIYEVGTGDNTEFGVGARVISVVFNNPLYTITVDTPNRKTFSGVIAAAITDRGIISAVETKNSGFGYYSIPRVVVPQHLVNSDNIPSNDREQAKIVLNSSTIGQIKNVAPTNQGINYDELPILLAPLAAILYDTDKSFQPGEYVYDATYNYGGSPPSQSQILAGPHGQVKYFDSDRNYLVLEDTTDELILTDDAGLILTNENDVVLLHNISNYFGPGSIITGIKSDASGKFLWSDRGSLIAINGSILSRESEFEDSNGFSSSSVIRLHNGRTIQDFSYFVRTIPALIDGYSTALGFDQYKDTLKKLVHPAGFAMFGETQIISFGEAVAKLYSNVDAFGNQAEILSIITIVFDLVSVVKNINMNLVSDNDYRAEKYKQLMILLEKYINIGQKALNQRFFDIIIRLYISLGGIKTQPFMFHLYFTNYLTSFVGFTPNSLDRVKFSMIEELSIFENVAIFNDLATNIFTNPATRKIVPMQPITLSV